MKQRSRAPTRRDAQTVAHDQDARKVAAGRERMTARAATRSWNTSREARTVNGTCATKREDERDGPAGRPAPVGCRARAWRATHGAEDDERDLRVEAPVDDEEAQREIDHVDERAIAERDACAHDVEAHRRASARCRLGAASVAAAGEEDVAEHERRTASPPTASLTICGVLERRPERLDAGGHEEHHRCAARR